MKPGPRVDCLFSEVSNTDFECAACTISLSTLRSHVIWFEEQSPRKQVYLHADPIKTRHRTGNV
jgi:hypothetical protein